MKKCSRCKHIKPYSQFSKCKSFKDGHDSYCKLCRSELIKAYAKTEYGRKNINEASNRYYKRKNIKKLETQMKANEEKIEELMTHSKKDYDLIQKLKTENKKILLRIEILKL
jgi:hypothetical protein